MLGLIEYDNLEYARSRLAGTIVRDKKGKARSIVAVDKGSLDKKIYVIHSGLGESNLKNKTDAIENMDLTPVRLGFAHSIGEYGISYLTRQPRRNDWRQGLRPNSLASSWGDDSRYVGNNDLRRVIEGVGYLNFHLAVDEVENNGGFTSICPNWAMGYGGSSNLGLYYKYMGKVGDIVNNAPRLGGKYAYLSEAMERELRV